MEEDQLTLGIGTRLQHTQYGPGVIVGVRYATYFISFIHHGIKEIDKTDTHLEEIIPENITTEIEGTVTCQLINEDVATDLDRDKSTRTIWRLTDHPQWLPIIKARSKNDASTLHLHHQS